MDSSPLEHAAQVNNLYALLAVICVMLGTAALAFFRNDKIWARLTVFSVLVGIGIYAATKAIPFDADELKKERETRVLVHSAASKRLKALEANLTSTNEKYKTLALKMELVTSEHTQQKRDALERQRRIEEEAQLERIAAAKAAEEAEQRQWEGVKANILWVFQDHGAKQNYDKHRGTGKSKYQSVIAAQAHNPNVQESIRKFGEVRTEKYIAELGH